MRIGKNPIGYGQCNLIGEYFRQFFSNLVLNNINRKKLYTNLVTVWKLQFLHSFTVLLLIKTSVLKVNIQILT